MLSLGNAICVSQFTVGLMSPFIQSVEMLCNILPELDVCSKDFDASKALNCKNIFLPYPKSKTYNNLAEYYSHTFSKKKNKFESNIKSSKTQHYVLKRNYAWYYATLGLDFPEDFDEKRLYLKYTNRKRNCYGKYKVDRTAEVKEMPPEMLQPIRSEKIIFKRFDGTLKKYVICKNNAKLTSECEKEDCFNVASSADNAERELESTSLEKNEENTLSVIPEPLLDSESTVSDEGLNKTARRNSELSLRTSSNIVCSSDEQIVINTCHVKRTGNEGFKNKHLNCSEKEKLLSAEGAKRKSGISLSNKCSDSLNLLSDLLKTASPSSKLTAFSSDIKMNNSIKKKELNESNRRYNSPENVQEKIQATSLIDSQPIKYVTTVSRDVMNITHDIIESSGKEKLATKRKGGESYNSRSKKARTDDMAQSVKFISIDHSNLHKLTNHCGNFMRKKDKTRSYLFSSAKHNSKCKNFETAQDKKFSTYSKTDAGTKLISSSNREQKSSKRRREKNFDSNKKEKSKHFTMMNMLSEKFVNSTWCIRNSLTYNTENISNNISCTRTIDTSTEACDCTSKEIQSSKREEGKMYNSKSKKDKMKLGQMDMHPVAFRTKHTNNLSNKTFKNKCNETCQSPSLSNNKCKSKYENIENTQVTEPLINVDNSENRTDARVSSLSNNGKQKITLKEDRKFIYRNKQQRIDGTVTDILPVKYDNYSRNLNLSHSIQISTAVNKVSKLKHIDSSIKTDDEVSIMKQIKVQKSLEDKEKKNLTNKNIQSVKSSNTGSNNVNETTVYENLSSKDKEISLISAADVEKNNLVCNNEENIQSSENFSDNSSVLNHNNYFISKRSKSCSEEKQATERKEVIDSKSKEVNTKEAIVDVQPVKLTNNVCNITNEQTHEVSIESFSEKSKETRRSSLLEECQSKYDMNKNIQNVEISDNIQISSSVKEFYNSKYYKEKALLDLARKVREELRAKIAKGNIEQETDKTDAEIAPDAAKENMNCECTTLSTVNNICDNSVEALKIPTSSVSNINSSEKSYSPVTVSINLNLINLPLVKQKIPFPEIPVLKERNSSVSCNDILVKDHINVSNGSKIAPGTKDIENRKCRKMT